MTCFRARGFLKLTATLLLLLLIPGDFLFTRRAVNRADENDLRGLFRWTVNEYIAGRFWEAAGNLELLLTYFDEDNGRDNGAPRGSAKGEGSGTEKLNDIRMKGKISLLLGACYERIGNRKKSRRYYLQAKKILEVPVIDGVDFMSLPGYQRIIMRKLRTPKQGVIEKPAAKNNKDKKTVFYIVMAAAAVAAIVAVLLAKKESRPEPVSQNDPTFDTETLGIQWALIPTGEFIMGDTFGEGDTDELPVHDVYLDEYSISKHEITFDQYDRYCEEGGVEKPSDNGWGRGSRPVINVTRTEALAFCRWLSEKTGKNIHLPTEAQWEKAAKGPNSNRYPWGNEPPSTETTNHGFLFHTQPVGSYFAGTSYYGVYDMGGNVAEWCWDLYLPDFYANSPQSNPFNSPYGVSEAYVECVIRGGSWDAQQTSARCADRWHGTHINTSATAPGITDTRSAAIGFRIAWEER